jgi:hypothetical protein
MRAEIVPLRLQQVRRQPPAAVAVEKRQRRVECRHWNAQLDGLHRHPPPGFLAALDHAAEVIVQQQVLQVWVLVEGLLDLPQEHRADDAAAAPHQRHPTVVQVPLVLLGSLPHQHEPLGVADDLGG